MQHSLIMFLFSGLKNDALLTDLEERFINNDKKVLINAKLKVAVDEPLSSDCLF